MGFIKNGFFPVKPKLSDVSTIFKMDSNLEKKRTITLQVFYNL